MFDDNATVIHFLIVALIAYLDVLETEFLCLKQGQVLRTVGCFVASYTPAMVVTVMKSLCILAHNEPFPSR